MLQQLEILKKELKIFYKNNDIQFYLENLLKDREVSVNKYIELMKNKFDLEKELQAKIKEIQKEIEEEKILNPKFSYEIDIEISGLINIDLDKGHFQEVMRSYL